ncbi:transcriptional regulator with XRE-family HTH domain [Streptacidiphilus sp. MAP12-20]|uniref:hypothetical protein n=1 Tax=Streptacidiphilus sp. MAP12-20 TaxID=3156299 RepID=UPI003518C2BE
MTETPEPRDAAPPTPPGPGATLADKIEYLRRATAEDPSKPPSYEQMAAEMNIQAGERVISTPYTWQLSTGKKDNPTLRHLSIIASHFDVDPSYFVNRDPEALRAAWGNVGGDDVTPLRQLLNLLAEYFGVDAAYFFDDEVASRIDEELKFLDAISSGEIRTIALRSAGLSSQALAQINAQIDAARRREGLDGGDT